MKLNDFELAINTAQAELGIDFANYSWVLENEDGVPWMEAMHSLIYRQDGQTVSVTPDYYFQTIQIRFGSRVVARSFDAFSGWMSKVVTWIKPVYSRPEVRGLTGLEWINPEVTIKESE